MISVIKVITQCRNSILMDVDTSKYAWKDTVLKGFLDDAVRELVVHRPSLLIADDGTPTSSDTLVTISESQYEIPASYQEALVNGVCARAFMCDSTDQFNAQRGQYCLARFNDLIGKKIVQPSAK